MIDVPACVRRACPLWGCALALLLASPGEAQTIDLSLNVFYEDEFDANSGGTWELVAKSTHSGIAGLSVHIMNIATAQNEAPRGTVNGSDPAGFGIDANTAFGPGRNLTIGQAPIAPSNFGPGDEQSLFYGVGTLPNGTPGALGPSFTSLTSVQDSPWGNVPDTLSPPFGNTAARMASGIFSDGVTPDFFAGTQGSVFTTVGTSTTPGTITEEGGAAITTIVRTNFIVFPDYNDNTFVDAADYVLWRETLNQPVPPGSGADGSNNGVIDTADYNLWRAQFGAVAPGAGLSVGTVPEPTAYVLLLMGALLLIGLRRPQPRWAACVVGRVRRCDALRGDLRNISVNVEPVGRFEIPSQTCGGRARR